MKKISVSTNNINLANLTDVEIYQLFRVYSENGTILNKRFDDRKWKTTDEYQVCNLSFEINLDDYKEYEDNLGIDINSFVKYLKTYILCKLGEYELSSFRQFLCDIRKIIKLHFDDFSNDIEDIKNPELLKLIDFFRSLPRNSNSESFEYIIESLERNIKFQEYGKARNLAVFDSYFAFNDLIHRFWRESQDKDEKLFFFPVWFWWRLSAVIPMRPREVVLTPRNCLRKNGDLWNLSIRKDKQKGNEKKNYYQIDRDYELFNFTITEDFANDINWYLENTKDYPNNNLNTLFTTFTHYKRWERCAPYTSRYFTYINLNTCLRYFFEFIVRDYYGYFLVDEERKHLKTNEIQKFCLGDTRHLSMIGLIFSGAPITVAQTLAGHDSLEIGAHYYSNVNSFIETQTYRNYKKLPCGERFTIAEYQKPVVIDSYTPVKGGKCYSKKYAEGNFDDCLACLGPECEIGHCQSCRYFRTNGRIFNNKKTEYEAKINNGVKTLQYAVKSVRQAKGYEEDISKEIFKLKSIADEYRQYLLETRGKDEWQE